MNWIGLLSLLLSIASTISTFFMISAIRFWLTTTGLANLDRTIEILNFVSFLVSLSTVFITYFIVKKCTNLVTFIISYAIGLFGLLEFYFGLFLWSDSKGYISTMINVWEKSLNQTFIFDIEKRFKCCSFHKFNQFYNDPCNTSAIPCLTSIHSTIAEPTEAIGITIIYQSVVHAMISLFLGFAAQKKKKKNGITLQTPWTNPEKDETKNFLENND